MSLRGETGWNAAYQKSFGKERWPGLKAALKGKIDHVALVNCFLSLEAQARAREENQLQQHPGIPLVSEPLSAEAAERAAAAAAELEREGVPEDAERVADEQLPDELSPIYFLDGGSALAALALGAEPGQTVLDLCAAPGGKSVCLASILFGQHYARRLTSEDPGGRLVCNEVSRNRVQRLSRVLNSFLPTELVEHGGKVFVTNVDAATGASSPPMAISRLGPFDRILVDAPCSSDRHLAKQGKGALAHWATGVVKANAERQLEILQCAARMLKPGGVILYSTCALAELENDGVVGKFLKKGGQDFEAEPLLAAEGEESSAIGELLAPFAEATAFGALVLPDRSAYGPMYMARLRRR